MKDTIEHRIRDFQVNMVETQTRIRRYTMQTRRSFAQAPSRQDEKEPSRSGSATEDPAATSEQLPRPGDARPGGTSAPSALGLAVRTEKKATITDDGSPKNLRQLLDDAWKEWLLIHGEFLDLPAAPAGAQLSKLETKLLQLDRQVDLIQSELLSPKSFRTGFLTVLSLAGVLVLLVILYLVSHGMRGFDFSQFEPWPEWGPLKYGEVAFWSTFGVLCWLLFLGSYYLKRRDFDDCYWPWYLTTALRAPFLAVILMLIVLEFVEWYGEGTWMDDYILAEGNKYYFIAFMSFCLGLTSDRTSRIIGDLAESVGDFVEAAVGRVGRRLSLGIAQAPSSQK